MPRRWLIAVPIGLVITAALFVGVMELLGWGDPSRMVYSLTGRLMEVDRTAPDGEPHIYLGFGEQFEIPPIIVNMIPLPPEPPKLNIRPEDYRPNDEGEFPFDQTDIDKLLGQPTRLRNANWILLSGSKPEYPKRALEHGKAGHAVIVFTISERGEVLEIQIKEASSAAFGRAAATAVRDWRFIPRRHDGKPVASENVTMRMEFRIHEKT